jgi:hypothetical protein
MTDARASNYHYAKNNNKEEEGDSRRRYDPCPTA